MARLFTRDNSYKVRKEDKIDYLNKYFISFEGVKTEPNYFKEIKDYLLKERVASIEIYPVLRDKGDGHSQPDFVRDGLLEFFEDEIKSVFDKKVDELWIVIDIDEHFVRKNRTEAEVYNEYLQTLSVNGIDIKAAISNPCFELWLILHFLEPENLDLTKVRQNNKIGNTTYMKNLFNQVKNGLLIEKTETAIINAKSSSLKILPHDLISHVGTSVVDLVGKIWEEVEKQKKDES